MQILTYGNLDLAGSPADRARIDAYVAQSREDELRRQQAAAQANDVAAQRQLLADRAGYNAQQSVLDANINAGAANIQAGLQGQRDYNQANLQSYLAAQHTALQEHAASQQEGIQFRQQEHGLDIQTRLQQVTLTQQEQLRLDRLRQARGSIMANPDLSPQERQNLITQVETGLNPLENRQREAQTLQTQVQTQGAFQNNAIQAQLFNQQQGIRAMRLEDRIRNITDANGNTATFFLNASGDAERMDFSQEQRALESHQSGLLQGAVQSAQGIQGIQQSQQLFPERLTAARTANQQAAFNLQTAQDLHPGNLVAQQLMNTYGDNSPRMGELRLEARNLANEAQTTSNTYGENSPQMARLNYRRNVLALNSAMETFDHLPTQLQNRDTLDRLTIGHQQQLAREAPLRFRAWQDMNILDHQFRTGQITAQGVEAQYRRLGVQHLQQQVDEYPMMQQLRTDSERTRITGAQFQNAQAWLRNNIIITELENNHIPGAGGAGGAGGGPGAGAGRGGLGFPAQRPAVTAADLARFRSEAAREVAANVANIGLDDTARNQLIEQRTQAMVQQAQALPGQPQGQAGWTPRMWESFRARLLAAPPEIRNAIEGRVVQQPQAPQGAGAVGAGVGGAMPQGPAPMTGVLGQLPGAQAGQAGPAQGPAAPAVVARQLLPTIDQRVSRLNTDITNSGPQQHPNNQAGLPQDNRAPAGFNRIAAVQQRNALQGISELMRQGALDRNDIATAAGYLQALRGDPHEVDLIRYFEQRDHWGILAQNLR